MTERPLPFLFDLDGTLADTLGDITASTNHTRRHHDLDPLTAGQVRELIGHGAGTLLRRALADLGLDDAAPRWREIYAIYARHHIDQCVVTAALYPGVREQLERLAGDGHPLGVVTNKPERFATRIIEHLDLGELLPVVVGGDTLPQRKPDPTPVRHALHALGCALERGGTMIGDGETDVRAGKAAGLRTIACLYGYRPEQLLRDEQADAYWNHFGDGW